MFEANPCTFKANPYTFKAKAKNKPSGNVIKVFAPIVSQVAKLLCYKSAHLVPVHKIHLIGMGGFCMLEQFAQ